MQHLNYCRQMVKQFTRFLSIPSLPPENRTIMSHVIDLASASVKFLMPRGGRLHDDKTFRALDESEPLRLPYPMIALEYEADGDGCFEGQTETSTKRIVFARERDDCLVLTSVCWVNAMGLWGPMPEVAIPLTGYLDRSTSHSGRTPIRILAQPNSPVPIIDYMDEVGALLCFLNVLQCGNVHVERSAVGKVRGAMRKKGALPFDDYHILTIDVPGRAGESGAHVGVHRSPREHLRRGHIRRYESGLKVWVNATVVNPGVGGKVTKDYRIAA